ncbi:fimbria/pilus periplasmic chaperone [Rickettsia felis]|uniref:Pili assembly chaperone N-terminal domain-containing protein n=2 Tax=Rickettsia felis TaxID=42862 RepID=Q4ULL8_RICFE|nr:fimbria/pilus periplasmic chaperone [Rickettsia felis]AAY61555.1 unknown [Rickettsia felis URRWXCal2]MDE8611819.1 fimbria/pilus periplasmic chaperone [Rickettsia felis]
MKKYFLRFLPILFILFTFNVFASATIVPVNIEISKDNKIATMTVQNNDYTPKKFQLLLLKRVYENGTEEYKETTDLVATPVTFTLHGGKTQLIRLALKNTQNFSTREKDYRIILRELPRRVKLENSVTSTVNLVVQHSIPITISR